MKACKILPVLLCCCLAGMQQLRGEIIGEDDHETLGAAQRTEVAATASSTQPTSLPDIHTVLREMSALVTKMEAMESRLKASEKTVEEQGGVIQELKEKQDQAGALRSEELRREKGEVKVSFSASVRSYGYGFIGPFSEETPLVYKYVFTNVGNAYNPSTGVFTAPVRGVYHFVVFVHSDGHPTTVASVALQKNGEHVVIARSHQPSHNVNPANGVSLLLEVGDQMSVKLWADARVYDDPHHYNTFSGHLLFTM